MAPDLPDTNLKMHELNPLNERGFVVLDRVLSENSIEALKGELSNVADAGAVRKRNEIYAIRNLLELSPAVEKLSRSPQIRSLITPLLSDRAFPVRAILFDKIAGANWLVPWHQDVTICVAERREVPGFGPWSIKAGFWLVQPPLSVLQRMVSVRIHLDQCDETNGALRVIPGTHRLGRLAPQTIREAEEKNGVAICSVGVGGVLLLKPLLVHASSAARCPTHRRVIHLDFANSDLSGGLRWATEIARHPSRFPI